MRAHEQRLRSGLLLLAVIPALLVSVLVLLATSMARLQDVDSQFEHQAERMSGLLASSLDYPLISNQPQLAEHGLAALLRQPGIVSVRVLDMRRQVWLSLTRPDLPDDAEARWLRLPIMAPVAAVASDDWLEAQPAEQSPARLGTLEVRLDHAVLRQRELGLLLQVALLALAGLVVVSAASWLIASRIVEGYDLLRLGARRRWQRQSGEVGKRERDWRESQDQRVRWGQLSHDLRTPLNGVTGMLELLTTTELNAEQTGYLAHARAAADSLLETLDRVPARGAVPVADDEAALLVAQRRWQGRRILLVEDDLVSQHLAQGLFAGWGVELVCVGCGEEGLALVRQDWDLVLVDGELPDMQADEFARAWRLLASQERMLPAPLVAVTAHTDARQLARYREAGLAPVLDKPLRRRSVLMVLTPLIA